MIRSSIAAATPGAAVGFAAASRLFSAFPPSFAGQQVNSTDLVMRYTRVGDTDLDRDVDLSDLGNLATSFGPPSGKFWNDGDLDFDGDVDLNDLGGLATYFGTTFDGGESRPAVRASPAAGM